MTLTVTSPEDELETITTTTEHPFYVIEQGFIEAGQQLASGKSTTLTEVNLTPIKRVVTPHQHQ